MYGLAATIITIVVGFPVAYWIAFHGGRRKNMYLLLLLMPFLVSFVLRTISWQFFLADDGDTAGAAEEDRPAARRLPHPRHPGPPSSSASPTTSCRSWCCRSTWRWNASTRGCWRPPPDLYAGRLQTFLRVVLPLSLPGVFAGVLMTFVPACS